MTALVGAGGVWRSLGSLKFALFNLAWLLGGVCFAYVVEGHSTWSLVLPLASSAVNLSVAIAINPVFRRQFHLLVFHLSLLGIVVLVALGRLTHLKGQAEVVEGGVFAGELSAFEAGPWHRGDIDSVRFENRGFAIDYAPGWKRGPTRNQVAYPDATGRVQVRTIGDQDPLVINGYRFYTSHNKGFAPTFEWFPASGAAPALGAVHLPAYPLHEYNQSREWTIPGTNVIVWTMLQFQEIILDPEKADSFKLPEEHLVVVRIGDERHELRPGGVVDLPAGKLRYTGLRAWMGYTVFYDWTIPWLLAAAVTATLALGWHFWRKFAARPWNQDGSTA